MGMEEFVFARPPNELSCVIGSLFTELEAPCEHIAHEDELVLCGTTFSGGKGVLVIRHDCCRFYGVCLERKCGRGRNNERFSDRQ